MAALKIGFDFLYSTLKKLLNKGATPPNNIGGSISNVSQINQVYKTYNVTIQNYTNIQPNCKLYK